MHQHHDGNRPFEKKQPNPRNFGHASSIGPNQTSLEFVQSFVGQVWVPLDIASVEAREMQLQVSRMGSQAQDGTIGLPQGMFF